MKKFLVVMLVVLVLFGGVIAFKLMDKNEISDIDVNSLFTKNEKENDDATIELEKNVNVTASVPIFMYHWLREDTEGYEYPENMVKPTELRKQMQYLKDNNYDVIFASELDGLQHYDKPVVLTFDDGWHDVYVDAFQLAKEFNMKICMYVIIDLIGTPAYCTLEELEEMRDSGLVEIDSHTLSHPYLDTLSEENINKELVESKKYLKEKLGIDSKVICYPSGRMNASVLDVAEENYNIGLLMDGGVFNYDSKSSNMYTIARIYARRSMTMDQFINYCVQSKVEVN